MRILSTGWTQEHSDALEGFILSGLSYGKSADAVNAQFGTDYSRGAAIGRAHRLGVVTPEREKIPPKPRKPYTPRPKSELFKAEPFVCQEMPDIEPLRIDFQALTNSTCHWPYDALPDEAGEGSFRFCGHKVLKGFSYCIPHVIQSRGPRTASERAATKVSQRVAA